jgi:hypothetical protein
MAGVRGYNGFEGVIGLARARMPVAFPAGSSNVGGDPVRTHLGASIRPVEPLRVGPIRLGCSG